MSSPVQPWCISPDSFPVDGYASDQLEILLGYAILAPSPHNTQPWLFRINAMDVDVFTDRRRQLKVVDPEGREMIMSCGAALYNMRVAAEYFEKACSVVPFPDPAHPHHVARFHLGLQGETRSEDLLLFQAITQRHTHRGAFQETAPPSELLQSLREAAAAEGAWCWYASDDQQRQTLADCVAEADRAQWANRDFRRELADWVRAHPDKAWDGLPVPSLGIRDWLSFAGPSIIRTFDRGEGQAARDHEIAIHSPVLMVLGSEADEPVFWLAAGQALQAVLLRARSEDLWASFLCQPLEIPELREEVARVCGAANPQVILRLGYADPVTPAPRRGVRGLLIRHETGHHASLS